MWRVGNRMIMSARSRNGIPLPFSTETNSRRGSYSTSSYYLITASLKKNDFSLHAGCGLSVDGNISSSFMRTCISCGNPYCREINTNFHVWVLQSSRDGKSNLREIGGDDPAVIYVKPGCEADIDALVQETDRLTTSVNETCSELCEKSEPRILDLSDEDDHPLFDRRWSKLLELRKSYL